MAPAKKKTAKRAKPVVGWRENASLPDLGVDYIKAKVDTGARTSAIHAFKVREKDVDGVPHVEFIVHPMQRKKKPEVKCLAPISDQRWVRSSNGKRELRYVIETEIVIGEQKFPIELTLTDRDQMGFRMLLGREALRKRFTVDPGASYLLSSKAK